MTEKKYCVLPSPTIIIPQEICDFQYVGTKYGRCLRGWHAKLCDLLKGPLSSSLQYLTFTFFSNFSVQADGAQSDFSLCVWIHMQIVMVALA
mmetsp:Transcript_37477/g.79994  ORF Transcript_37477/g.79994 Transcript_37477/m.79994 type:complete len:92 (+) Transcript_37477:1157-1432(+)